MPQLNGIMPLCGLGQEQYLLLYLWGQDRHWVSFMYSYPNLIPLNQAAIRGVVDSLKPLDLIACMELFQVKSLRVLLRMCAGMGENARWLMGRHLADLARLRREILEVEKHLKKWADSDTMIQKLLKYPGVGLATATMLRAEIGEFDRFRTGKQLARYLGLSPRNASSGERQVQAGMIKAGNTDLRMMLIQLAHRLKRYNARWRSLAEGLKKRGKPGSVIAAAVANRWVRWLHYDLQKKPAVAPLAA